MSERFSRDAIVFALLVVLGAATRLVPYYTELETWNVTATAAAALFAGFYFADWRIALAVPLLAMAIADTQIGVYRWELMTINYAAISLAVGIGSLVRSKPTVLRIASASVLASTSFFVFSNFAEWLFIYPLNVAGFLSCYTLAIPFYLRTMAGDLAFSAILFGAYFLATNKGWLPAAEESADAVAAT